MSALHGLILLYEKQFQIAALRNTESEQTGVVTSITATGWIHVTLELEKNESENKSYLHQLDTHVWKGMIFLASDPNPSVAQMAQHVVHGVHDKVCTYLPTCTESNFFL